MPELTPTSPISPTPHPWRLRLLIGGSLLALIIVIVGGWLFLRRQIAQPIASPTPVVQLPVAEPAATLAEKLYLPPVASNVAFTLHYQAGATTPYTITNIVRTNAVGNLANFKPNDEGVPLRLRVTTAQGQSILDQPFSLHTKFVFESDDLAARSVVDIPEVTEAVILPGDKLGQGITRIELLTPTGQVVIGQEFNVSELSATLPPPAAVEVDGTKVVVPEQTSRGPDLISAAHAQSGATFNIIVMGSKPGVSTSAGVAAVHQMVSSIQPWTRYQGSVVVAALNPTIDVGCTLRLMPDGRSLPNCPNTALVAGQAASLDWDAIAVVVDGAPGVTGTSCFGCAVLAVSPGVTGSLIGHEIGHGIAALQDEYLGAEYGAGQEDINCFTSQAECSTQPFAGLACTKGCNGTETWRPSSELMFQLNRPTYGAVENYYMEEAIQSRGVLPDSGGGGGGGGGGEVTPPVISPNGGHFATPQQVRVTAAPGLEVHVLLRAGPRTVFNGVYTGPLNVTENSTVQAYAQDIGIDSKESAGRQSATVTATFEIGSGGEPPPPAKVSLPQFTAVATASTSLPNQSGGIYRVTITSDPGATIYYKLGASIPTDPTSASPRYAQPLTASTGLYIKAFATKTGLAPSDVALYRVGPGPTIPSPYPLPSPSPDINTLAAPTITPTGGPVPANGRVTIAMPTGTSSSVQLHYTLDGSTPSTTSSVYTQALRVTSPTTVKAIAVKGAAQSPVTTATFSTTSQDQTNPPQISPNGGFFEDPVTVTLSVVPKQAGRHVAIYYTLDRSTPTTNSPQYTGPFTLDDSATVKAMAVEDSLLPSEVVTAVFKICNPCFYITVVGDAGAPIEGVVAQVNTMVQTIEPWKTYAEKIVVVPVANTKKLGCREVLREDGTSYPLCPDDHTISQVLNSVRSNSTVVTTANKCDCGTVATLGNHITTVGQGITAGLLAHQMGHSLGTMVDEYFYKYGYRDLPPGPNCFTDEASCVAQRTKFPDLECAPGCQTQDQWRPNSLLMHNETSEPYGSFDECIMAGKIAAVLRKPVKCEVAPLPPTPTPPPVKPGGFWGWSR